MLGRYFREFILLNIFLLLPLQKYKNCKIGLINGTGTNACYLEKGKNAEFFNKPKNSASDNVIINTEFGAFGEFGSLEEFRNSYDREVDENSLNPSNQLFDKMISGEISFKEAKLEI